MTQSQHRCQCSSSQLSLTAFRIGSIGKKPLLQHNTGVVLPPSAAQQYGKSAYLGLEVVAHDRDMVEQGVSQNLSGLIPLRRVTAVTLRVALKR